MPCASCESITRSRRTHAECPANPRNLQRRGTTFFQHAFTSVGSDLQPAVGVRRQRDEDQPSDTVYVLHLSVDVVFCLQDIY